MVRPGSWPTPWLIIYSDWTVNTPIKLRPSHSLTLKQKPCYPSPWQSILLLNGLINDQITQTINWKRFTANWLYLTSFNSRHWPFLHKDTRTVMRSVKKTRVTLFIADPGIVSVKMRIFLLTSDISGEHERSTFLSSFQLLSNKSDFLLFKYSNNVGSSIKWKFKFYSTTIIYWVSPRRIPSNLLRTLASYVWSSWLTILWILHRLDLDHLNLKSISSSINEWTEHRTWL